MPDRMSTGCVEHLTAMVKMTIEKDKETLAALLQSDVPVKLAAIAKEQQLRTA